MSLNLTSADGILKQYYTDDMVENMVYKDNPFFAMVPKMENFEGRNLPLPIIYGNPQGRSATFSQAQSRGALTNSQISAFLLTRVKDYSIATIDNETIYATKSDKGAFLEAATVEIDGAINSLSRSLSQSLYRSGFGTLGQIANSSFATNVITLVNPQDVVNFEINMVLSFSALEASGALRGTGGTQTLIVTNVSRVLGSESVTVNANLSTVTGGGGSIGTSDFIQVFGDRQDTASPVALKVAGLEAWLPAANPASTAFFGVDRSVDTRLGGLRYDGSALPIEEALIDGANLVAREGWALSHYFMGYKKYSELVKSLGAKVQYIDMKINAEVAFRGVMINGARGPIKVVPDQNCTANRVFGVDMSKWKLYSLGKAVRVIDTDGLQMLRQASSDGVECRYGFYGNLGTRAPGSSINIQVSA